MSWSVFKNWKILQFSSILNNNKKRNRLKLNQFTIPSENAFLFNIPYDKGDHILKSYSQNME